MFDPEKTPSYFLKERSKKKRVTWSAKHKSTCQFDLPQEQHADYISQNRKVQIAKKVTLAHKSSLNLISL